MTLFGAGFIGFPGLCRWSPVTCGSGVCGIWKTYGTHSSVLVNFASFDGSVILFFQPHTPASYANNLSSSKMLPCNQTYHCYLGLQKILAGDLIVRYMPAIILWGGFVSFYIACPTIKGMWGITSSGAALFWNICVGSFCELNMFKLAMALINKKQIQLVSLIDLYIRPKYQHTFMQ